MVFFWKCDLGSPEEVEFQDAVGSQLEEDAVAVELQDFLGGVLAGEPEVFYDLELYGIFSEKLFF